MRTPTRYDWRTISALNVVSALAQVGQFGIAFVMVPVWLAEQGFDASQLGLFAAATWLGQLPGLAFSPRWCQRFGERWVIAGGLLCTVAALVCIPMLGWPWGLLGGTLSGFGLGLRWIGVEPWLYRIAPSEARGRLVGFHETLIALAPIVAPLLVNDVGIHGNALFWIGSVFTAGALLPLAFTRAPARPENAPAAREPLFRSLRSPHDTVLKHGMVIALLGGLIEAAVSGLFAIYTHDHGLSVRQTAQLLAYFGLGGLVLQYGIGWLADHRGVGRAAGYCAGGTVLVCIALAQPMAYEFTAIAVFLLGGFVTAYLTLALIASTLTATGTMAANVSFVSMIYTVSAVAGPLFASAVIRAHTGDALMWFTAAAAGLMILLLRKTA